MLRLFLGINDLIEERQNGEEIAAFDAMLKNLEILSPRVFSSSDPTAEIAMIPRKIIGMRTRMVEESNLTFASRPRRIS